MEKMSEETVKMRLITPALEKAGWDKQTQITCEHYFTDGQVFVRGNIHTRGEKKRADYLLSIKKNKPIAIVEAKDNSHTVGDGLQQALNYGEILDIPFVYSSNGFGFVEHDRITNKITDLSMDNFPSPNELWNRYKTESGITENEEKIINEPYYFTVGSFAPRYYQRIAINRTVEAVANGQNRILITMATGTGKTYTASQIVWRLWKAGMKKKILYLADRNILIDQTMIKDFKQFDKHMIKVQNRKLDSSYEIYFALYQQLASDDENDLWKNLKQLQRNFFDLVIIDECHRGSAKEESLWRQVLEYFNTATHIGMTATPREDEVAHNLRYFGKPIYTYSLKQGIEDGFLAPYKVVRVGLNVDLEGYRPEKGKQDINGELIEDREYNIKDFDKNLVIDERTKVVANRITTYLKNTNRYDKTIVFCIDIDHAERMRQALINENSDLVKENNKYIMRITGDSNEGKAELDNFIDPNEKYPVIVTTSKLLTTGVDCQMCKLIVLDTNVESMTEFKQIIGRGTRLREDKGKSYFTIMDFRNVSRKFSDPDFDGEPTEIVDLPPDGGTIVPSPNPLPPGPEEPPFPPDGTEEPPVPPFKYRINGVDVKILSDRIQYLDKDGKLISENLTDYSKKNILNKFASLEVFLKRWNQDAKKNEIIKELCEEGVLLENLRTIVEKTNPKASQMDDFDLICHIAYDKQPLTKSERVNNVKKRGYLYKYSETAQKVLNALLDHYMNEGLDDLGTTEILKLDPFNKFGGPSKLINEFGGKDKYLSAIKELEDELYNVAWG